MSDGLNRAFREMFPGLEPGVRVIDGERFYSAAYLDDRHLRAVPDKEQPMDENFLEFAEPPAPFVTAEESLAAVKTTGMPLSDALVAFAETLDGDFSSFHCAAHGMPLEFFARPDLTNVTTNVNDGYVWLSATLTIGGHDFKVYSKHFPAEAKPE